MPDLAYLPARALASLVRRRKIGCAELLEHQIDRIERRDGELNAVVVRDFAAARKRARALDRMKEPLGPLHGVPMTVKESFDIAGHPTTWGQPEQRGAIAAGDALAVQRLRRAGAVVMGKTNVPLMLADWQSYNEVYGSTNNPWDLRRSPGGSSGGSAAALAAGFSALECGSDIGGSIRQPAHACGVYGHKPSWGLLPTYGHAPVPGVQSMVDISCIGPLARSAGDLALALDLLAGPDPLDTTAALRLPAPPRGPQGLRVAIWAEDAATHTDADVTRAVLDAGRALKRAGAKVSTTARPQLDPAQAFRVYLRLLGAVVLGRMAPAAHAEMAAAAARLTDADRGADDELLRAVGLTHAAWLGLHEQRNRMRRAWGAFFRDWDVLICPAHAVPAQPHQQGLPTRDMRVTINGTTHRWNSNLFWPGIVGGMLLPATAAPLGPGREGLPIGCQIVGPMHGDRTTIAVAAMLEKLLGGFIAPPGWND